MSLLSPVRRILAAALCLALLPHHALSKELASMPARGMRVNAVSISAPRLTAPSTPVRDSAPSAAGIAEVRAVIETPAAAAANIQVQAASMAGQVGETLGSVGPIERAEAGSASSAGRTIQDILNRRRLPAHGDVVPMGAGVEMAAFSPNVYLAKPAGQDSIDAPARQLFGQSPPPNVPNNDGGGSGGDGPQKAPLIPRLITAAVALAPAALLGWPLFAGGSVVAGLLVMGSSLGVALLPFMSERSSPVLRAMPGVVIAGLGLFTLAAGLSAGWAVLAMGGLVTLGAWGFIRFATGSGRKHTGSSEILGSFFGALGAVAGAGIVLLGPAGWIAGAVHFLAYPATLILFMHLPGWIGRGMEQAFRGYEAGVRDNYYVLRSISRDTTARKRLEAYSRAAVDRSSWNALWLGLLVWLPIGLMELVRAVVGIGAGLLNGTMRAPFMFAWGAASRLGEKGAAERFFAGWARSASWMTKTSTFNNLEKPLIPLANSDRFIVRAAGGLLITAVQLGWTVGSILFTALGAVLGWIDGIRQARSAWEEAKHDARQYRLESDPLPSQVPSVPTPTVTMALPAKLIAASIGLAPLWWMFSPLLTTGIFGWIALAGIFAIGLMPLMPGTSKMPSMLRDAPGSFMVVTGGMALIGGFQAWLTASLIGLPTGMVLPLAALAVAGGYGLRRMVDGLLDKEKKTYNLDRGEYIAGYAAALAIHTALSAALLGMGGYVIWGVTALAFLLSPFLLYHLPSALWKGVWTAVTGLWKSPDKVGDVMGFWRHETKFDVNLKAYYRRWLDKSFWYGTMLIPHFLVTFVGYAVELALTVAVGVLVGITRIPSLYMYGFRSSQQYDSAQTKFWGGFNRWMIQTVEGSKATAFDPWAKKLHGPMSEKRESSHPTLGAMAAFGAARLLQLYWLLRVLVLAALTPLLWIGAWRAGQQAKAAGEHPNIWSK